MVVRPEEVAVAKFSLFDIEYADLLHEIQDVYGWTDEEIETLKKASEESKKKIMEKMKELEDD